MLNEEHERFLSQLPKTFQIPWLLNKAKNVANSNSAILPRRDDELESFSLAAGSVYVDLGPPGLATWEKEHCMQVDNGSCGHPMPLNEPKKQIRLIHLRRLEDSGIRVPYDFKVVTFDRKCAPKYIAASYMWASSQEYDILIMNGTEICVPQNVGACVNAAATACNTDNELPQFLWLDQICIDQKNLDERSQQVSIMGDIYRSAEEVLLWFGSTGSAMHLFHPGDWGSEPWTGLPRLGTRLRTDVKRIRWPGEIASLQHRLQEFVRDPYWTRLWIVQEVLLAKRVRIGWPTKFDRHVDVAAGSCAWDVFAAMCEEPWAKDIDIPLGVKYFLKCVRQDKANTHDALDFGPLQQRVHDTIGTFCENGCTDPRDKIFGLQGLVAQEHRIEVDYSMPVRTVYLNAVRLLIQVWDRPDEWRSLVDLCLDLGSAMLPAEMRLRHSFNCFKTLTRLSKSRTYNTERQKREMIKGFETLIAAVTQNFDEAPAPSLSRSVSLSKH